MYIRLLMAACSTRVTARGPRNQAKVKTVVAGPKLVGVRLAPKRMRAFGRMGPLGCLEPSWDLRLAPEAAPGASLPGRRQAARLFIGDMVRLCEPVLERAQHLAVFANADAQVPTRFGDDPVMVVDWTDYA